MTVAGIPWDRVRPGAVLRIGAELDGIRHWRAYSLTSDPDHPEGLVSVTVNIRVVTDRAPKNVLSVGDVIRQESVLSNAVRQFGKAKGAPVGSDAGTMKVVSGLASLPVGRPRAGATCTLTSSPAKKTGIA